MEHLVEVGSVVTLKVCAKEVYSKARIIVKKGQKYEISCDPNQRWIDLFIKTSPDGFCNILAWLAGLRVKKTRCFCLCGAFNETDDQAFAIGSYKVVEILETGSLSFFANDATGYYGNNKGAVFVSIKRLG